MLLSNKYIEPRKTTNITGNVMLDINAIISAGYSAVIMPENQREELYKIKIQKLYMLVLVYHNGSFTTNGCYNINEIVIIIAPPGAIDVSKIKCKHVTDYHGPAQYHGIVDYIKKDMAKYNIVKNRVAKLVKHYFRKIAPPKITYYFDR